MPVEAAFADVEAFGERFDAHGLHAGGAQNIHAGADPCVAVKTVRIGPWHGHGGIMPHANCRSAARQRLSAADASRLTFFLRIVNASKSAKSLFLLICFRT